MFIFVPLAQNDIIHRYFTSLPWTPPKKSNMSGIILVRHYLSVKSLNAECDQHCVTPDKPSTGSTQLKWIWFCRTAALSSSGKGVVTRIPDMLVKLNVVI